MLFWKLVKLWIVKTFSYLFSQFVIIIIQYGFYLSKQCNFYKFKPFKNSYLLILTFIFFGIFDGRSLIIIVLNLLIGMQKKYKLCPLIKILLIYSLMAAI